MSYGVFSSLLTPLTLTFLLPYHQPRSPVADALPNHVCGLSHDPGGARISSDALNSGIVESDIFLETPPTLNSNIKRDDTSATQIKCSQGLNPVLDAVKPT